jgi:hypothetical protein
MNKTSLIFGCVAAVAMLGCEGAWADAASVAGVTYQLKGKFGGSAGVTCRVGGTHNQNIKARRKLGATITFNEDGTFAWSGDALLIGTYTGQWTQKGTKVDLDFDNPGTMSFLQMFGNQTVSSNAGGASFSGTFSPTKYDFKAKINAKGNKIEVIEKTGFKMDASASAAGSSNSCKYNLRLTREYTGKAQ